VERAEAGSSRTEPTPRWRSLFDRARRTGADDDEAGGYTEAHTVPLAHPPPAHVPSAPPATSPVSPPVATFQGKASVPAVTAPPRRSRSSGGRGTNGRAVGTGATGRAAATTSATSTAGSGKAGSATRSDWPATPANASTDHLLATLRRELRGPKVLAFANPKGGVHKTTATVLAAAAIGGARGRGVVAWDDNELRGTLGLRAGSARHARTIRHLVRDLAQIEATGGPELYERLDDYLRHASDGPYDVLAGEESPRFAHRLDAHTVRRVLELLRRVYDVVCVDTGNNVESANWQTVLAASDQLVITTVPREDAAFTADWMIDLLHESGLGDLATNAVTLVSCPTPNPSPLLNDLAQHFAARTRAVVVVPYDPLLESGSAIEHTALAPATRRAWLQAAAVMMDAFDR
jgi:MinD-like ATPase involved in chromosome partitioning or flagellar assembly